MTDELPDPIDPRIARYVRNRAQVSVPEGLIERAGTADSGRVRPIATTGRWPALGAIAALLALVVVWVGAGGRPQNDVLPSDGRSLVAVGSSAPSESAPSPLPRPSGSQHAGFPNTIGSMPVVDITQAVELLNAGRLDGRAVAVKGYWIQTMALSCPAPPHFLSSLEQYCRSQVFSSEPYDGVTCTEFPDHTSCRGNGPPGGAKVLEPLTVRETNYGALYADAPVPAVLIIHSDDPRAWQCRAENSETCHRAVVVDSVAWANGRHVNWSGDQPTWIDTELSADEVRSFPPIDDLIALFPLEASEAHTVDPRFRSAAGANAVWVARAVRPNVDLTTEDPTVPVDVYLIDDSNGKPIQSFGLEIGDDYQPARLRVQSLERSYDSNSEVYVFYRVELPAGQIVHDISLDGSWSGSDGRHLPGLAAILEPGTYVARAWRAEWESRFDDRSNECSTEFTVAALDDKLLEAFFPLDGPCQWREPTFDDSL